MCNALEAYQNLTMPTYLGGFIKFYDVKYLGGLLIFNVFNAKNGLLNKLNAPKKRKNILSLNK